MTTRRVALLALTHAAAGGAGFAAGIYTLPLLIAPEGPSATTLAQSAQVARFKGRFRRDLAGSDSLHWGEGEVSVGPDLITLQGRLSPGPDYKLYLSPEYVDTEAAFERAKPGMLRVGDVKTFENFALPLAAGTDLTAFTTVVVWCETFRQFISAARYR